MIEPAHNRKPSHAGRKKTAGEHSVLARHFASGFVVRLTCRDGLIAEIETLPESDETEWWVAPALVDIQVNGFAGVDFQAADLDSNSLLRAVEGLQQAGCTRFLLTLVTDEWSRLLQKLDHLRKLRAQSAALGAAIAGWHVEGPFLSAAPGYCGAHDPSRMLDPTPDRVRELRQMAPDDPMVLTLSPERSGALETIAAATSLGIKVSLGHTDATAARLAEAVAAGASGFTHLGNGCPQELDRHDNILWRVLETGGLTVSVIPDRIHVSPPLFRLLHRFLPAHSVIYISDAMAAAGAPPGRYPLGTMQVEVGKDEVVRQPGRTNFAGSALRPVEGVWRAAEMLGVPWQQTWRRFSQMPADWLGLPSGLRVGQRADFCLFKVGTRGQPGALRVFVRGQPVA